MSVIHVYMIEKGVLYLKSLPYTQFLDLLKKGSLMQLKMCSEKRYLDSGFIILDIEHKQAYSQQTAFSQEHLPRQFKGWGWVEWV